MNDPACLQDRLDVTLAELDRLAARWMRLHAAGRVRQRIALDYTIDEVIRESRRIEKKLRRARHQER